MAPRSKKTKRTLEEGESSQQDRSEIRRFDSNEFYQKFHDDFAARTLIFGKYLMFIFFDGENIPIRHLFQNQGWIWFIQQKLCMYSMCVRLFYTHLKTKTLSTSTSFVNGVKL
ncbi:hypothetical protein U1Q18_052690 [Sarracenia purpurea var. burkii]